MKNCILITSLFLLTNFVSCQQPNSIEINKNTTIEETTKKQVNAVVPENVKTEIEIIISRDEKSKDSNYRCTYYNLKGNFLVSGEKINGRFSNKQKPEKIVKLSNERLLEIKERVIKYGLNSNYEKNYISDPEKYKRFKYNYIFTMDNNTVKIVSDTDVEDDPMVENIQKLCYFLSTLIE